MRSQILLMALLLMYAAPGLSQKKKDLTEEEKLRGELRLFFDIETDRFDENQCRTYEPKVRPYELSINGIYASFKEIPGVGVYDFRLTIQHKNHSGWLFIRDYSFSIDGKAYRLDPMHDVKRDCRFNSNAYGTYYEWADISIGASEYEFLTALYSAKSAEIKYNGSTYYLTRKIPKAELASISSVLYFYKKLGGTF